MSDLFEKVNKHQVAAAFAEARGTKELRVGMTLTVNGRTWAITEISEYLICAETKANSAWSMPKDLAALLPWEEPVKQDDAMARRSKLCDEIMDIITHKYGHLHPLPGYRGGEGRDQVKDQVKDQVRDQGATLTRLLSQPPHPAIVLAGENDRALHDSRAREIMREKGVTYEHALRISRYRYDEERRRYFDWLSKQDPHTQSCLDRNYRPAIEAAKGGQP